MNFRTTYFLLLFMLVAAVAGSGTRAEGDQKNDNRSLSKVQGTPVRSYLNVNSISTVIKNTGITDIDVNEANSGLFYPKGSGKAAVFVSGFLWGARIEGDPQVRVGGSAYREGLQGGKITNSGLPWEQLTAESEDADHVRIYRVRPDVYPGGPEADFTSEIADNEGSAEEIRAQYETDWANWPAADGAPYEELNGVEGYQADGDVPGVPGADQTVWFVANDLNQGRTTNLYGAVPLGIEMQATFWAYNRTGALGSMIFRKYKIINKSNEIFHDMYVSMWSDVDLGNASDDFAGCDTTLSLGYCYNASAVDATYNPLPPPAVGFDFFQGPIQDGVAGQDLNNNGVDDAEDYAIFNNERVGPGKINLPMTSFYYFARGDANVTDPTQGDPQGSTQFYNFFQGRIGKTGEFFVDPTTGEPTTFTLTGDPVTRRGWIDGQVIGASDRRIGQASGPFDMQPGETQEIVVAEIVAGALPGVDRLSAIGLLKFYDRSAQDAFDNFFDLPTAPPAPEVNVVGEFDESLNAYYALNNKIILDWGDNPARVQETESFNSKGYAFEGYNVYQLPNASASVEQGRRIATYDKVNGVLKVEGEFFDVSSGVVARKVQQFGEDSGIKRFLEITTDAFKGGSPLINGIRYYFAVTSYAYNPDATITNLENPIQTFTVIPTSEAPGVDLTESGTHEATHIGTADANVEVEVVDPTALTGHEYEIYFDQQHFYLGQDGVWRTTNYPDSIGKLNDVSPSTLIPAAVYSATTGAIDLNLVLDLQSPTQAWVDGIILTFPAGVQILDAPIITTGGGDVEPLVDGNTVSYGLVNNELTQDGTFHGGEVLTLTISSATLPLAIDYVIKDDGYEAGGNPIDAVGTATVTEVGNYFVTQNHWNLRDLTTGEVLLEDQTIFGGQDVYAEAFGPGGSTGSPVAGVSEGENIIVDGLQFRVSGSFEAPITIGGLELNGTPIGINSASARFTITDFTNFGYADGTANTSFLLYSGLDPAGNTTIDVLQQDYELRFTGIEGDTTLGNGNTLKITQSGGSYATLFGASAYDIANHPLNPNPGSDAPFAMRIPFEVWNTTTNKQVNVMIWHREGNATTSGSAAWNSSARMYVWILNTDYSAAPVAVDDPVLNENLTWVLAFYKTDYQTGDVVSVLYDNPIQFDKDTFRFTAPAPSYSADAAKADVEKINVFPNPYYGVNSEELNKYNRFVTFTHLPAKATIRLFNLAGVLVRTIEKNDISTYQRWDLANDSGLPVASGLYIAYIDMPDLGQTKILKVAIIQEQQILDRF